MQYVKMPFIRFFKDFSCTMKENCLSLKSNDGFIAQCGTNPLLFIGIRLLISLKVLFCIVIHIPCIIIHIAQKFGQTNTPCSK